MRLGHQRQARADGNVGGARWVVVLVAQMPAHAEHAAREQLGRIDRRARRRRHRVPAVERVEDVLVGPVLEGLARGDARDHQSQRSQPQRRLRQRLRVGLAVETVESVAAEQQEADQARQRRERTIDRGVALAELRRGLGHPAPELHLEVQLRMLAVQVVGGQQVERQQRRFVEGVLQALPQRRALLRQRFEQREHVDVFAGEVLRELAVVRRRPGGAARRECDAQPRRGRLAFKRVGQHFGHVLAEGLHFGDPSAQQRAFVLVGHRVSPPACAACLSTMCPATRRAAGPPGAPRRPAASARRAAPSPPRA